MCQTNSFREIVVLVPDLSKPLAMHLQQTGHTLTKNTAPRTLRDLTTPLTFVFLCISIEFPCGQDKRAIVRLVLGFHPATRPGICKNKHTEVTHMLPTHYWRHVCAGAPMQGLQACDDHLWVGGFFRQPRWRKDSEIGVMVLIRGRDVQLGGDGETDRAWW